MTQQQVTGVLLDAKVSETETNESSLLLFSWILFRSRDLPHNTHVGNSTSPNLLLPSVRTNPAPLFREEQI